MQELVINNVKTAQFNDVDLNKIFDPESRHSRSFAFKKCDVASPYGGKEGKLAVKFYTLAPGKSNYPYHYHTGVEEVFYIISGTAKLRTPKGDIIVSEGDVIVMPPNENGAHQLTNHSDVPLVYLDIDTVDTREVCVYPDTNKVRVMAGSIQKSFLMDSDVNYLHGE